MNIPDRENAWILIAVPRLWNCALCLTHADPGGQVVQQSWAYPGYSLARLPDSGQPDHCPASAEVSQGSDARAVEQAQESWLLGEHHFELDGQSYQVTI